MTMYVWEVRFACSILGHIVPIEDMLLPIAAVFQDSCFCRDMRIQGLSVSETSICRSDVSSSDREGISGQVNRPSPTALDELLYQGSLALGELPSRSMLMKVGYLSASESWTRSLNYQAAALASLQCIFNIEGNIYCYCVLLFSRDIRNHIFILVMYICNIWGKQINHNKNKRVLLVFLQGKLSVG